MPRCPNCGAETEARRQCEQCGAESPTEPAAKLDEVDDETLILRLLESPVARGGAGQGARIWLLDPSGGEIDQASELREEITIIGRNPECGIRLPSNTVSRRHAQIRRAADRFLISDLGSTNGTLLNSESVIGEEVLKDRDEIGIGIYRLIFRCT